MIYWHKPQWAMLMAFQQYSFYQGKSKFNAVEKGLGWCYDDTATFTRFRATANYDILINKGNLKLIDFFNYIKKHFSLNTLKCIGY